MKKLTNYIILTVAICFTVLQPFLHVHLDAEHPIQQTGFHMGNAFEELAIHATQLTDAGPTHASHTSEIISIDSVFKQDVDLSLTGDTFALALILFCFSLFSPAASARFLPFYSQYYQALKRRLPVPRAPPQT